MPDVCDSERGSREVMSERERDDVGEVRWYIVDCAGALEALVRSVVPSLEGVILIELESY